MLAAYAGSCGPGHVHLVDGLYDRHRSRVPVLAIAAQFRRAKSAAVIFRKRIPNAHFSSAASIAR
jgi:pyruvate dehydrogenase (quinone)